MTLNFNNLLNPHQLQAVTAPAGNLLVLAGAGSGKTRVLVHRIAWLITNLGASPNNILSVTFTNKAAKEMKSRLAELLDYNLSGMWTGTFHSIANRLLRIHSDKVNLPASFQVMDSEDQLRVIKKLQKSLGIDPERFEPKNFQIFISNSKDSGIRSNMLGNPDNPYEKVKFDFYKHYEQHCKQYGLVDFSELLLLSFELLRDNSDLASYYQEKFNHILIDEFQDTNSIQYNWLCLLGKAALSVTAVGDDDQSIYGWRGAKVENIYKFLDDFPNAQKICLEQNYRSTSIILEAANAVIKNNNSRLGKNLWTEVAGGEPITLYNGFNEQDEARFIVQQIKDWVTENGKLQDIGILYRSNAQSRVIEDALVRSQINYEIYGGLRFFERAEIKDALSYLRLIVNKHDDAAFERVINTPPRGIGAKSLETIKELANILNCSYWDAARKAITENSISGRAKAGFISFMRLFDTLLPADLESLELNDAINFAVNSSGLLQYFKDQKGEKAQSRAENLQELVSATNAFSQGNISDFLSHAALDADAVVTESNSPAVQLMTIHSAKGLEFKLVFLCGVEESLFPHYFSKEGAALEEERRLCYVAMTRAMQRLVLTCAKYRKVFGRDELRSQSRFISEIPSKLIRQQQTVMLSDPYKATLTHFDDDATFVIGSRVSHAKFGLGTILNSEGNDDNARVQVKFDQHGAKWLLAAYAKLECIA